MLCIVATCLLVWFAINFTRVFQNLQPIFSSVHQSDLVKWFVWFFPLPFVLPLFDRHLAWILFFPVPLGMLYFAPAILAAIQNRKCFELSGDEWVKPALAAVRNVITVGILGVMGVLFFAVALWIKL